MSRSRCRIPSAVSRSAAEPGSFHHALMCQEFRFIATTECKDFVLKTGQWNDHAVCCFRHVEVSCPGEGATLSLTCPVE